MTLDEFKKRLDTELPGSIMILEVIRKIDNVILAFFVSPDGYILKYNGSIYATNNITLQYNNNVMSEIKFILITARNDYRVIEGFK